MVRKTERQDRRGHDDSALHEVWVEVVFLISDGWCDLCSRQRIASKGVVGQLLEKSDFPANAVHRLARPLFLILLVCLYVLDPFHHKAFHPRVRTIPQRKSRKSLFPDLASVQIQTDFDAQYQLFRVPGRSMMPSSGAVVSNWIKPRLKLWCPPGIRAANLPCRT